jgi:TonB family protein
MLSFWKHGLSAAVLALAAVQPVLAQNALQQVKDLYASAAYEDTLSAVTSLGATNPKPEVEQYRVFSLVALGRMPEADQAVEAVLRAHPRFRPESADASPRIQELFTRVRSRIGPVALKAVYTDARAALDKKDRESAVALFGEMLQIADDPDIKDQPLVGELKALGTGFLELSRALPARARGPSAAGETQALPPVAPVPSTITGPIAIRETLPGWNPPNSSSRFEFEGTVQVSISATGTVDSAEIVKSIHPVYDALLLRAARGWTYQPARRNGVAMPSDKLVTVRLKPPA